MYRRTLLLVLIAFPFAAKAGPDSCGCGPKDNPEFRAQMTYNRALLTEDRQRKINLLREVLRIKPDHAGAIKLLQELGVDPAA